MSVTALFTTKSTTAFKIFSIIEKEIKQFSAFFLVDAELVVESFQLKFIEIIYFIFIFILLSRESVQCAVRAHLGVASRLSTTPRWGNPTKCPSQRHNK